MSLPPTKLLGICGLLTLLGVATSCGLPGTVPVIGTNVSHSPSGTSAYLWTGVEDPDVQTQYGMNIFYKIYFGDSSTNFTSAFTNDYNTYFSGVSSVDTSLLNRAGYFSATIQSNSNTSDYYSALNPLVNLPINGGNNYTWSLLVSASSNGLTNTIALTVNGNASPQYNLVRSVLNSDSASHKLFNQSEFINGSTPDSDIKTSLDPTATDTRTAVGLIGVLFAQSGDYYTPTLFSKPFMLIDNAFMVTR